MDIECIFKIFNSSIGLLIKVFRLQRKTLLLFFGFFFPIIIFFFLLDFSEMRGRISLKFSEVVGTGLA